jgi:hypothetical protein
MSPVDGVQLRLLRAERSRRCREWPRGRSLAEINRQLAGDALFLRFEYRSVTRISLPLKRWVLPIPCAHDERERCLHHDDPLRTLIDRILTRDPLSGIWVHHAYHGLVWLAPHPSGGLAALLCPDHGPTIAG